MEIKLVCCYCQINGVPNGLHRWGCGNIADCAHKMVGEHYGVTPDSHNPSNPKISPN
jgi:hypothetical protein